MITGLSGSGKSSLAFDTLYAEGQRRYVESLSAYARQFLSLMEKPDVDHIEGLSPRFLLNKNQHLTTHVLQWEQSRKFMIICVYYLPVWGSLAARITISLWQHKQLAKW